MLNHLGGMVQWESQAWVLNRGGAQAGSETKREHPIASVSPALKGQRQHTVTGWGKIQGAGGKRSKIILRRKER